MGSSLRLSQSVVATAVAMVALVAWTTWRTAEGRKMERTIRELEAKLNAVERDRDRAVKQGKHDVAGQLEWTLYWKADAESVRAITKGAGLKLPDYAPTPTHQAFPPED